MHSGREHGCLGTHTVRFPCHVEWPPFEAAKVLEKDCDKGTDVFGRLFASALWTRVVDVITITILNQPFSRGTYHVLSIVSI